MNSQFFASGLCFFLIFGSAVHTYPLEIQSAITVGGEKTLVLYDAVSGDIPSLPLMNFASFPPGEAIPVYSDGATALDTTIGQDTYGGWTSRAESTPGFPHLDREAGYHLDFNLQIENESHSSQNRAGFSVLLLGQDARGIELGFWQDQIWAQSDDVTGGLFKHGEGVTFATTAGLTEYRLTIISDTYTLAANSQPILSGPLRDYSGFEGFPDPYETANFLFLGDDTTSAQARFSLGFVSITGTEPATSTETSTSTSTPLPGTSPAPPPSVTPVPSLVPAAKVFEVCPSGGIVLVLVIFNAVMMKRKENSSERVPKRIC